MVRHQIDRSLPPLFRHGFSPVLKLLLCLLVAVILLLFDKRFQNLVGVREIIVSALYPLEKMISWPREGLKEIGHRVSTLRQLFGENETLRASNTALTKKTLRYDQLESENTRLRTLLELRQLNPSRMLAAEVLYETRDPAVHKIIIDRGSQQGLRIGMPIIDQRGLIGQVTRVFPWQSEVTLLTDKSISVPVQLTRTGLRAIASGSSKQGYLELQFVAAGADLQVGDILMTSGLDGVYPPGLPVAKLVEISNKVNTQFALVSCLPIAQLHYYRQVMAVDYDAGLSPPIASPELPRDRKGRLLNAPKSG